MRARLRMTKEATDSFIEFGADDVLKFAGLGIGFRVSDGKCIGEEALGKATAANHVAGAALAGIGEVNFGIANGHQTEHREALQRALGICVE